ncbi:MAG: TonB-dependent receptor, partial [Verrucomicrobia bacterium]|nr:TonB-dependent receptor [Verrucomicrobiota bacterium]
TGMRTSLMNVPMSINVITSEFLEDSLVGNFEEAMDYNSSITQTGRNNSGNARGANFSIRGFRNRNLLTDGVTGGQNIPTQMIDRIEIVKGPNTLYGQSDPGGLVNVITKTPKAEDGGKVAFSAGNNGRYGGTADITTHAMNGKLGLRFLGEYRKSEGWRWVDGDERKFMGLSGNYQFAEKTQGTFNIAKNRVDGFPTQRATWSFEEVPTDLNGDGDTTDPAPYPGGIAEARARYNNTFIPDEFVSSTAGNVYHSDSDFLSLGLLHTFSEYFNLQYKYNFYDTQQDLSFREFNTFRASDGRTDSNMTWQDDHRRDEVHTINGLIDIETGDVRHQILVGARKSDRINGGEGAYRLRAVNGAENARLRVIEAKTGKKFRDFLYKQEILDGVKIWEDDVASPTELREYGVRTNQNDRSYEDFTTIYLTDNIFFMDDRLNILAGVRHNSTNQKSYALGGAQIGNGIDASDTNFQLGGVYRITPNLSVFVNSADAFEPNSATNADTGELYDPQTSKAIEAGVKFVDLFDGKVSGSVALFKIEKENVFRSDYNPVTFKNDFVLTADESKGFEVELFVSPIENWEIVVGYSYIDAAVSGAQNPELEGLRLEGAAPHRFTLFNNYTFGEGPVEGLRIGGGVVWADGPIPQFGTPNNALVFEDGYTIIDLFARYPTMIGDQPVTFGINIDNATDEIFVRSRAATNESRQILFSASFDL